MTHRFTPEEIEGFLTFLTEGGADKRCSNVYLIITQLRDDLAHYTAADKDLPPEPPRKSAQVWAEDCPWWYADKLRTIATITQAKLINIMMSPTLATVPDFEEWWKIEKTKPPYTYPKAVAKSAWDAALHIRQIAQRGTSTGDRK